MNSTILLARYHILQSIEIKTNLSKYAIPMWSNMHPQWQFIKKVEILYLRHESFCPRRDAPRLFLRNIRRKVNLYETLHNAEIFFDHLFAIRGEVA